MDNRLVDNQESIKHFQIKIENIHTQSKKLNQSIQIKTHTRSITKH